jgi:hypothetical protein
MFELANFSRQDLDFMYFRPAILILSALFLAASGTGCQKSKPRAAAPPTVLPPDTIASVHWLGKQQLGYEATAFFLCGSGIAPKPSSWKNNPSTGSPACRNGFSPAGRTSWARPAH